MNKVDQCGLKIQPTTIVVWERHVDVCVASGRYSHIGLGVGNVGIFVGTHISLFCENPLCVVVGASHPHVGVSHPLGGINNSNLMLSLEGFLNSLIRLL